MGELPPESVSGFAWCPAHQTLGHLGDVLAQGGLMSFAQPQSLLSRVPMLFVPVAHPLIAQARRRASTRHEPDLSKVVVCDAAFTADGRPPVLPQRGEQRRTSFLCRTSVDWRWPISRNL